jgi:hypothetical protein
MMTTATPSSKTPATFCSMTLLRIEGHARCTSAGEGL